MAQPGVCGVMHGGMTELSKQKKKQELTSEVLAYTLSVQQFYCLPLLMHWNIKTVFRKEIRSLLCEFGSKCVF